MPEADPPATEHRPAETLLEGQQNFRDLGGKPTTDGRLVRRGVLFRSGNFQNLTDRDWELLSDLGINTVCDLRTDAERATHPTRWRGGKGPEVLALQAPGGGGAFDAEALTAMVSDPTGDSARASMVSNYKSLPAMVAPALGMLVERVLQPGGTPAVVHCTAGKDRTGMLISLLLQALGVEREAIVEDYLLTDRYYGHNQLRGHLHDLGLPAQIIPEQAVLAAFASSPDFLALAQETIDEQYGSFERYLADAAGVDEVRRERLRDLLLER